jgi:hypothetical protein
MINREWHEANRMPKNPTEAQRVTWHREHKKHCACRPVPASLRELVDALERAEVGSEASR